MKELKRYGIKDNGDYYEREDGEWVSADDAHAALEAVEAREAELRETINSVAVCQKHVTEITAGACMICEIEQLREQAAQARRTSQYWKDCHIAGNAEIDKLRARVAELEQQVPKWVPDAQVKAPLVVMPMPFWRGYVLCANALPAAPKEEV